LGHSADVKGFLVSEDRNILFSCSEDKTIRMWDIRNEACLRIYSGHKYNLSEIILF